MLLIKNISKFKNEICNSDKIISISWKEEPIEIQKDTAKDRKVGSPHKKCMDNSKVLIKCVLIF